MAELLLELLSEEIPARMQMRAADDLRRLVCDGLKGAGIGFEEARAFVTPRRLALVVDGIPASRDDVSEEKRGPRVGAPDQAVQGFLKGAGLKSLDQAEKRDTGKGEFWFAVITRKGGLTADALPEIISTALRSLPWPKSMRWGSGTLTWVRPIRSIVALFDGLVIPGGIDRGGGNALLRFSNVTRGHRFLSTGDISVLSFADYTAKLRTAYVILDSAERKKVIEEGAEELCVDARVSLLKDPGLLDEVAGLVEWPVPLLGKIDDAFLELPYQVLVSSMRTHQRYFPTWKSDLSLANRFVVVANNVSRDCGKVIVEGNERVLRARLSDAKFFWDQDRKQTLESRLPALTKIVFHAKLGTQAQRVERIVTLASHLAKYVPGAEHDNVVVAARLCKADLVSGMVGEFPELQGVMGGHYARHEGLSDSIADAIRDQYAPAGPSDRCPSAPTSIVLALAEKLETLGSLWSAGERPSGSGDPYGLRRATLGILRILVENDVRIDLVLPLFQALVMPSLAAKTAKWRETLNDLSEIGRKTGPNIGILIAIKELKPSIDFDKTVDGIVAPKFFEEMVEQLGGLLRFVRDRIRVQARDRGIRSDVMEAVIAIPGTADPIRLTNLAKAVEVFIGTEAGKNLLTAYGRAANIVRAEEKRDKGLAAKIAGAPDAALLEQAEEKAVASALAEVERVVRPALAAEDFAGAMKAFAGLRAPIDALFDKVTVNVTDKPELRLNRLKLLNQIRATMDTVADFSKIEG
jgi:glycyl-tRNA synthetase beta chain